MKNILFYVILIPFLYAMLCIPIPNGTWQEYLLLITSVGMTILGLRDEVNFKKTTPQPIIPTIIFQGTYGIIFYILSDFSFLEIISLVILSLPLFLSLLRLLLGNQNTK